MFISIGMGQRTFFYWKMLISFVRLHTSGRQWLYCPTNTLQKIKFPTLRLHNTNNEMNKTASQSHLCSSLKDSSTISALSCRISAGSNLTPVKKSVFYLYFPTAKDDLVYLHNKKLCQWSFVLMNIVCLCTGCHHLTSNSACLWMSSALCRLRINSASLATRTRWSFMVWLSSLGRREMDISLLQYCINVFTIIIKTFYYIYGCQFTSVRGRKCQADA